MEHAKGLQPHNIALAKWDGRPLPTTKLSDVTMLYCKQALKNKMILPNGSQFFCFRIHFHQKAPASEVSAPPPPHNRSRPPTGNPGSPTVEQGSFHAKNLCLEENFLFERKMAQRVHRGHLNISVII